MPQFASLIVAVYNKPEYLRCILEASRRQTVTAFEMIVADDGSGPDIAAVVEENRNNSPFPIQHAWHEDEGWRKNRILNQAIRMSSTPYLIFLDGDCIPHKRFIEDHIEERRERTVLAGRRVDTSARWTQDLSPQFIRSGAYERIGMDLIMEAIRGEAQHIEKGLWLKSRMIRTMLHPRPRAICGYNFSLWKKDIEAVNGFDECYTGPGFGEDSDLEYRLDLIGISIKTFQHRAIVYHVRHPKTVVPESSHNRFNQTRERAQSWCEYGLTSPDERV